MSRKMLEEQRRAMEVMEQLEYTNEMFGRYVGSVRTLETSCESVTALRTHSPTLCTRATPSYSPFTDPNGLFLTYPRVLVSS